MKVFLTGGAGFIGSFVARKLVEQGDEVIVYDSFVNFIDPFKSHYEEYLKFRFDARTKEKIKFMRGDIRNKDRLLHALMEHKPEVVVHLAALPIATTSDDLTEEATEINLNGTVNLLEAIKHKPSVKRFIYTSSSMIYGDFEYKPADENHPKNPKGVYGATKLAGEILTQAFCKMYNKEFVIIRPSAVYGPTDANKRVTQIFVENALEGKPLTLHNGGESQLDFTYVDDLAEGFVRAIKTPEARNQLFNITAGNGRSLKELAEILKKLIPNTIIEYKEAPKDEKRPERGTLGIFNAKKLLGYEPKYQLEEGIANYVEFVKKTGVLNIKKN